MSPPMTMRASASIMGPAAMRCPSRRQEQEYRARDGVDMAGTADET